MPKECKRVQVRKHKFKFEVRAYNRCVQCGRARAYYRKFGLCRICLREGASKGLLPGVVKSSW